MEPKHKERGIQFFKTYLAFVLTLRNTPEWPALRVPLDLSLNELVESTYGDILPSKVIRTNEMHHDSGRFLNVQG